MNYYQHQRSNSLLQRAYLLRSTTSSVNSNEKYDKYKIPIKNSWSSNNIVESSKNNDSYLDLEAFKDKIFSPEDTVITRYSTPIKKKPTEASFSPINRTNSFHSINGTRIKKTLILDLDETLVHSSFRPFHCKADMEFPVAFDGIKHKVYVLKRPYVDEFLRKMNEVYDIYIFTASISPYANPLLDKLDVQGVIKKRLYREHCVSKNGGFVKDLSIIGKDIKNLILLDNNPISYNVNQLNGMPILTWHDNKNDQELLKIIPLLEHMALVDDVRKVISKVVYNHKVDYIKVKELITPSTPAVQYDTPKKNQRDDDSTPTPSSSTTSLPIERSKSITNQYSFNNYEKKLEEWSSIKEKIAKNIDDSINHPPITNNSKNSTKTSHIYKANTFYNTDKYNTNKITISDLRKMSSRPIFTLNQNILRNDDKSKSNEDQGNLNKSIGNPNGNGKSNSNSSNNIPINPTIRNRNNVSDAYKEPAIDMDDNVNANRRSHYYTNSSLNFLMNNNDLLDHSSSFYQSNNNNSSYTPNRLNENHDLKRNSSCSCISHNTKKIDKDNNSDENYDRYNRPQQQDKTSYTSYLASSLGSSKALGTRINGMNQSNNFWQNRQEEEEEKNYKKLYNDIEKRNDYSLMNLKKNNYEQQSIYIEDENSNYYNLRRKMMNKTPNRNDLIFTPKDERYNERECNEEQSSFLPDKKRLMFNTSTITGETSFTQKNYCDGNEDDSTYCKNGYTITKREQGLRNTATAFYTPIDHRRDFYSRK